MRYAGARGRPDAVVDAVLGRGDSTVDVVHAIPPDVAAAIRQLDALMAEVDTLCESEQRMSGARSVLQKRFARWYLDQFVVQATGGPATPWDGPLDPD